MHIYTVPIFRDTRETSTLRAVPYPLACGQEATSSTCLRGQHCNASNSTASSCKAQPQMSPLPTKVYRTPKRKKAEPYALPSAELMEKLANKFPRLRPTPPTVTPPTGDG